MFIYNLVNFIPSPINNNILLVNFQPKIEIRKLTGYPNIDFNIGKIFYTTTIIEFIKMYILIFLEIDLLFFSDDLEKLNMTMYILYILNYPLTDSNYFWHIKSISKEEMDLGDESPNTSFKGVHIKYNNDIDLSIYENLSFIVDLENKNKKFVKCIGDSEEAEDILTSL